MRGGIHGAGDSLTSVRTSASTRSGGEAKNLANRLGGVKLFLGGIRAAALRLLAMPVLAIRV